MTDALNEFRARGVRLLTGIGWISAVGLLGMSYDAGYEDAITVLPIAVGINMLPTVMALRRRHDRYARLIVGLMIAVHPALYLYALSGHDWQMDAHLFFLVALAGLTLLCDWKPLAAASLVSALHHVLVEWLVPQWAFSGAVDGWRVVIHGIAILGQFVVLAYVTHCLRGLIVEQAAASKRSDQLALAAQHSRERAEALQIDAEKALASLRAAEQRAASEQARRVTAEEIGRTLRRTELLDLADTFEASVATIVGTVKEAASTLGDASVSLSALAGVVRGEAAEAADAASQASMAARAVATRVEQLHRSSATIAEKAAEQVTRSTVAQDASRAGNAAVSELAGRATNIREFANVIRSISSRTNLLSLNATIEAARVGAAGLGFAVVAGEVKILSTRAAAATDEITDLTDRVHASANVAETTLSNTVIALGDVSQMATAICRAVEQQRDSAYIIEHNAADAAQVANTTANRVSDVALRMAEAENMSTLFGASVRDLIGSARNLEIATEGFIGQLRVDQVCGDPERLPMARLGTPAAHHLQTIRPISADLARSRTDDPGSDQMPARSAAMN